MLRLMGDLLKLIWLAIIGLFRSRALLEADIVALRHELNVLRRKAPKRLAFNAFNRLVFASLYRIAPNVLSALVIVKPATVIRWHCAGFRLFWRWKSRSRGGRPRVPLQIRQFTKELVSLGDEAAIVPGVQIQVHVTGERCILVPDHGRPLRKRNLGEFAERHPGQC
jgi:hypothetical protein